MNKENEFNLNLSNNSYEDVPIISISNKSKSNSSNNTNKKNLMNNFASRKKNNLLHNKTQKSEKSYSLLTFTQNSIIPFYDRSFNENKNLSIENKSKSRSDKKGQITPKKHSDKNNILMEKLKIKKKDVLTIDNIHGKNLMEYFEKMRENIVTEEKDKNRVSSVGNKLQDSLNIQNNNINTNKSWNKNKYRFLNLNLAKKPIKIERKKFMNNFNNTSSIKNLQNLLLQNNINIDLKNLINKYRPSLKIKNNDKNEYDVKNDKKKDKKLSYEKIKNTPKTDIHKRKLSFSHLKLRETVMKNLFHDNNIINNYKKNDEKSNIYKYNKYIRTGEKKSNIFFTQKRILPNKNINNNNTVKENIKKINNYDELNTYYLKYKEKEKMELQKIQKQNNNGNNKIINNKMNNKKNIK